VLRFTQCENEAHICPHNRIPTRPYPIIPVRPRIDPTARFAGLPIDCPKAPFPHPIPRAPKVHLFAATPVTSHRIHSMFHNYSLPINRNGQFRSPGFNRKDLPSMSTRELLRKAANALPAGNPVKGEIEAHLAQEIAAGQARAKRARQTMRDNLKAELL